MFTQAKKYVTKAAGMSALLLIIAGAATGTALAARGGASSSVQVQNSSARDAANKPWLGMAVASSDNGVIITSIVPGGPSSSADLEVGDIITAVEGVAIDAPRDLKEQIRGKAIGDAVALSIKRAEQGHDVSIILAERPQPSPGSGPQAECKPGSHFGLFNLLPELEGVPPEEIFSHLQGAQFQLTDKDGNPATLNAEFGAVTTKTDASLTVKLNNGGEKTYQVTGNTLGKQLLSRLETGDEVIVLTAGASTEARLLAPGNPRIILPGLPAVPCLRGDGEDFHGMRRLPAGRPHDMPNGLSLPDLFNGFKALGGPQY